MGPLDLLFGQVQRAIQDHSSPNTPGPAYDSSGILGTLAGLFGQHAQQNNDNFDPQAYQQGYDQQGGNFGNVLSSDQDPYGDPGQQQNQGGGGNFGNVLSSDQDPYGDPGRQR